MPKKHSAYGSTRIGNIKPKRVGGLLPQLPEILGVIFTMREEITISHPVGQFVFIVRDKEGAALYVGGTRNIDKKSFAFPFPYETISGYYYKFPDFRDEIDRAICRTNAVYNTRLNSYRKYTQVVKEIREDFYGRGLAFRKEQKMRLNIYLNDCDSLRFRNEIYYASMDIDEIRDLMLQDYGTDNN